MSTTVERYTKSPAVLELVEHQAIINPTSVEHFNVPVSVDSEVHNGVSDIHISVADVPNPRGVCIMPASWSDYGKRPAQVNRLGTMAAFSGLRMIGIDFPGMGDHVGGRGPELIEKDFEDVKNGRMTGIVTRYWEALEKQDFLTDVDGNKLPLALWGHSLSTLTVAEMAATIPEGYNLTDVYMSEIMALEKSHALVLAANFGGKGGIDLKYYDAMNSGSPEYESVGLKGLVLQVLVQREAHMKAFSVLTKGKHSEVIDAALDSDRLRPDQTRLHVVDASDGLTSIKSVAAFSDGLRSRGFKNLDSLNRNRLMNEYHGYQDSLPALLAQMSKLAIVEA